MAATWSNPVSPEELAEQVAEEHGGDPDWLDRFSIALDHQRSARNLSYLMGIWGLSGGDTARIFGVSRQAVAKWRLAGVPPDRAAAHGDLIAATDLLVRYIQRDRISAVVRRPTGGGEGPSLLELAGRDPAHALEVCREMFDFSRIQA